MPRGATPADRAQARAALIAALAARPSLADTIRARAAARGIAASQISAARSSFGQVSLMDPRTGLLGLRSPTDPAMTSADKYDYIARAGDPQGAVRAVLEGLLGNQPRTVRAMNRRLRITQGDSTWDDKIVKACYREILVDPGDVAFAYLCADLAGGLSECWFDELCRPEQVSGTPGDVINRVMGRLEREPEFASQSPPLMQIVVYQVWLGSRPDRAPLFLRALGRISANLAAQGYVDLSLVRPTLATLLPNPPSANAAGELRLALLEVKDQGAAADPAAIAYLRRRRAGGQWSNPRQISAALSGLASAAEILQDIREPQPAAQGAPAAGGPAPPAPGGPPRPNYNLDVDGEGRNDMYVIPLVADAINISDALGHGPTAPVFARPDPTSQLLGTLGANQHVDVIGETEDHEWYVIQYGPTHRLGFVKDVLPI